MKKVNPALLEKLVSSSLFEDEMMMGDDSVDMDMSSSESDYVVKAMCSSEEGEESEQEFMVSAMDPEEAKMKAMDMAKESGYSSCQITSVELAQEEPVASDMDSSMDMSSDSGMGDEMMAPMESKKKKGK
jgi:hypothetical protein